MILRDDRNIVNLEMSTNNDVMTAGEITCHIAVMQDIYAVPSGRQMQQLVCISVHTEA